MKVRAKERLYENGAIYPPGTEFEVKKERAAALGDSVEPVEKAKKAPNNKMVEESKNK